MRFVDRSSVARLLNGRTVAIVGSGPGVLGNAPGLVDEHEVVIRVNNYRIVDDRTGRRCDVHYSFFGRSIKKTADELIRDGVKLIMCKCPDSHVIESEWHRRNGKMAGVDFRWIYRERKDWWPCDVFVPDGSEFLTTFYLLGKHVPTTGFSAIFDVLQYVPRSLYLTGFDGFRSGLHNLNEPWRQRNTDDPIGHVPERELAWLAANVSRYPIRMDAALSQAVASVKVAA